MKPIEVRVTLTEVARHMMPQASNEHIDELARLILNAYEFPPYMEADCQALLEVVLKKAREKE